MNRLQTALGLTILAAAAAGGGWWLGVRQGQMGPAPSVATSPGASPGPGQALAPMAAADNPDLWTIPQGESATRRHIQSGLKAGDLDPSTGLRILNYHDPMVPGKNFDAPAKSPFMDMMLVPRYAGGGAADNSSVSISPRIQQNLGLRTAAVQKGQLTSEVTAVGTVVWNERDQVLVSARADGYIEKLHVRAELDRVEAGAPLIELHLPRWIAAQEEYLALSRMQSPDLAVLREAALARLRQLGMSELQIQQFLASGSPQQRVTLTAPIGGIVSQLKVREGASVNIGMPLLTLQGTGRVWVEGEIPEAQAALIKAGMTAAVTSPALPGQDFNGRVQMLLPGVEPLTRTRKARLELANTAARLVPGMTVQMRFVPAGRPGALLVPSDAVIRTGRRSLVMLALPEGRFQPVEVRTGLEVDGRTEVISGLQEGQQVVLSAQFLVDSEASLRGLTMRLGPDPAASAAPNAAAAGGAPTHRSDAQVKAVDGDMVTLDHPPIPSLKWPQMVMDFQLPAAAQRPARLAAGDRVQFEFQLQEGELPRIVSLKRLASPAGAASRTTK